MAQQYHIIRNPQGFLNFEEAGNFQWIDWMLAHGYEIVGGAWSDLGGREIECRIVRGYLQNISSQ